MTGCAGSREMCSCLVMLPDACQNLHSWNVNDAERELQAIRSAAGHGCTRGGPRTRSCRITSQACVFVSIKSVSVHAHVQTCIHDHAPSHVLFPTRMRYKH